MKKALCILLALLMLLPALAACSESKENTDTPANTPSDASDQTSADVPGSEGEEETESPTAHWDAVAKPDLGGMDIIATTNYFDSNFYNVLDWDEISGDNLKDAMYNRNRAVEAALGCKFTVIYADGSSTIEKSVRSGSGDVDFAYNLISEGGGLIQRGVLAPFDSLENIDMTQPYWDQGAQNYLRILGKMYFGFVDFGFDHYDSLAVLFYNGKLVTDYQLDDPQQLVLEDAWTIDKMAAQLDAVLTDVNGDGKYTLKDDILGLTGREYWFQPFLNRSGEYLVTWDEGEENFVLHMMDDRFVRVSEAISTIYGQQNPASDFSDYDKGRIAFSDGRSLFYSRLLGDFRQLREVEDDYGVVCFPRYSEEVGDSSYFVKNPTTLYLPTVVCDTNGDGEQDYPEIGLFLEAMGAYTFDETLNVYLENTVIGKGMRDEQSANMVRLMMKNRSFDLCEAFGLHDVMDIYHGCVVKNEGLSSGEAKARKMFDRLTGKIVDKIREFDDGN
jgi:ABC-type glycerol-3-phosphate transport system substrate-binding protein